MSPQCFIFIGRSGSGKGTQANLLIDALKTKDTSQNTLYIQPGQELREFIKGNTYTQGETKKIYDAGKLIPEFLAVQTWINVLVQKYNGTDNVIFDGSPRKLHEAGVLNSIFSFYHFDRPWVFHIDIGIEEAVKRLLARNRQDDSESSIRNRLAWYDTEVVPTIDYFRTSPNYHFARINGERPVEEIFADIAKMVGVA
jgi:adenylate kinase